METTSNDPTGYGTCCRRKIPAGQLPNIYSALTASNGFISDKEDNLVLEVTSTGENTVRAISMDTTDGLKRDNLLGITGAPIAVPVEENPRTYYQCYW